MASSSNFIPRTLTETDSKNASMKYKAILAQSIAEKAQPWKALYQVHPLDMPTSTSLHDKPYFKGDHTSNDYEAGDYGSGA
ncbi:hypothetical protein V498_08142 [Pseudogymnoascus sp. VKM F-4517 (FW-2822)]|nr:hypothetical protein V498_08142 [Pseudogymnoascus sp. VKM F-4517 (FW-2822)]